MARSRLIFALIVTAVLLMACVLPLFIPLGGSPGVDMQGILDVNIDYTGTWYRDTFNYTRDAANVRHFVLVIPERNAYRVNAGGIFASLSPQPDGGLTVRDDLEAYGWALGYVYEAPGGYFEGDFAPGNYEVAAAFITAPLSREEAGVGEDAILWAGVTGGGASTDLQAVTIAAGETTSLTIQITDNNGWACPWLYVLNGQTFERRTEILRDLSGAESETTEITPIGSVTVIGGWITVRVVEEKEEVTYVDSFYLLVNDVAIPAEGDSAAQVAAVDGNYLTIRQGESYEFRFRAPASFTDGDPVSVAATGYYMPLE